MVLRVREAPRSQPSASLLEVMLAALISPQAQKAGGTWAHGSQSTASAEKVGHVVLRSACVQLCSKPESLRARPLRRPPAPFADLP